jgi:hypothetical protein
VFDAKKSAFQPNPKRVTRREATNKKNCACHRDWLEKRCTFDANFRAASTQKKDGQALQ